jgi:hypothetical protein
MEMPFLMEKRVTVLPQKLERNTVHITTGLVNFFIINSNSKIREKRERKDRRPEKEKS